MSKRYGINDCMWLYGGVAGCGGSDALLPAGHVYVDGGAGLLHVPGPRQGVPDLLRQVHPQVLPSRMGWVKPGADHATRSNWTVQSRLLVCGGLQLVRDDPELFLMRFKFQIAVQSRFLVCAVLQLARNNLFIGHIYSQLNCPVVSHDAE